MRKINSKKSNKEKNVYDLSFVSKDFSSVGSKSNEKKEAKPSAPVSFARLFRFADSKDQCLIFLGVMGSVFSGLSAPANTFIFGDLTNTLVKTRENISSFTTEVFLGEIDKFSINNSIIGAAVLVLTYFSIVTFNTAGRNQLYRIRTRYFQSAIRQNIGWYDLNSTGDFASRMSEDLNKLEDGLSEKVLQIIHCMSAFTGCIILALVKGWELALISLSSLPIIFITLGFVSFLSSKLTKNQLESYAQAGAIAEEVFTSIRTVVAFNGQKKEEERYGKFLKKAMKNNIYKNFCNGVTFGLLWFMIYGTYGLAFWYGVSYVFDGKYTPGEMTTIFLSVMVGCMNLGVATPFMDIISSARAAASKIFWVIDRKSSIDPCSEKGAKPETIKGNIEFKNVNFSYPSRPDIPILKDVSFKISTGETIAFVGSSGSGKSTCVQLIQRFYDPDSGQVSVDDQNAKDLNVSHYRKFIGVVGQEPVLFAATIKDNIRFSKEDATMEEIEKAAKMANAHDFIVKLPQGYNTVVGDRGAQMSGGQKQRIAIARALIRNPSILLLDEATSALDNASEAKVQAALDKASKGRTTIIVAHRLSTIRQADKIFVMSKGQIIEEGNHDNLLDKKGHYYDLVMTQTKASETPIETKFQDEDEVIETAALSTKPPAEKKNHEKKPLGKHPEKEEKVGEKIKFSEILKLSAPEWLPILIATIASMLMGFSSPFFSIVFGDIMGVFPLPKEKALEETERYCIYFAVIGVCMGLATFVQIWVYGIAGEKLTRRLRYKSFSAMLKQEMSWYDDKHNSVGALCSRLSGDTSNVQGATGQPIGSVVQAVATIGLAVGFAMYFQWKLGLTTLAICPFLFGAGYFMAKTLKSDASQTQRVMEKSSKIAIEAVGNIRTVASLGRELSLMKDYENALQPTKKIMLRAGHIRGLTLGTSRSLMFFAYAICMFHGGRLIAYENENYENVFKVTQILIMASFSVANAFAFAPNFQKAVVSATTICTFLKRVPLIRDSNVTHDDPNWTAEGNVYFDKISFKYPLRPNAQILRGFTLQVLKGKKIALVGQSGCGKSTVIQLLERFYDPDEGVVKLDTFEIQTLRLDVLRKQLGIVSQEPVLFDKTIAENIAYGDNDRVVTMDEIIDAAKQANIHNFVSNLPLGYETTLGEKGTQLSGGQKQRVAIARALIRKPKVLLLDEATSALDTQSEKVVQEALDKASSGRTCITIAHRLSTIQDADVIAVIHQGKVAEMGKHGELMAKKGIYSQLYALQGK